MEAGQAGFGGAVASGQLPSGRPAGLCSQEGAARCRPQPPPRPAALPPGRPGPEGAAIGRGAAPPALSLLPQSRRGCSQRPSARPAAGMARRAAVCLLLLCCALPLGSARAAPQRTPSFGGRVAENRPAGTRVQGLSVPLTRLGAQPWCAQVRGRRWRLQLLGEGHAHFQAALHARTARVWLRTRRPLDREARPLYALRLALRCARRPAAPAEPLAALTVRVLDANDNAPRFVGARPARLRLDETLPLGSAVWRARAEDADAGANAELRYFARPPSEHFFVVPRSGSVLLVRSLLHLRAPIPLRLYARDRGRPALLSAPLELEVLPQAKRLPSPPGPADGPQRRRRRAPPLSPPVPEDARRGRPPGRFEPAAPAVEDSALPVETESDAARPAARLHGPGAAGGERLGRGPERQGGCRAPVPAVPVPAVSPSPGQQPRGPPAGSAKGAEDHSLVSRDPQLCHGSYRKLAASALKVLCRSCAAYSKFIDS